MITKNTFFILLLFIVISCNKEEAKIDKPNEPKPIVFVVPKIIPKGTEKYLKLDSDYIFNQDSLYTFELKLPEKALAQIDADPAAEQYVEGMMIFQGDTISPVGIRYKGSIGAFVGCLTGLNFAKPSGYKTCTKLSMKIDIKWKDREERFYKLNKLQFHSQNLDRSKMRERLGYWLFHKMGVPGPRSVHARLIINGQYNGLFALTEQIDSRFAKYNYKDDEGNMYKEVWPLSWTGISTGSNKLIEALETNEDNNPSVQIMKEFGEKLAKANPAEVPKIIEQYMNIDEIMSYIAVDRTIRHDDGPFHWYCNTGDCTNHNYYWYEEPKNQKLHLVPWDMDNAFENIISNVNSVTPIADKWGTSSNNCQPFAFGPLRVVQWSANCDKLTAGWARYTQKYEEKRKKLIDGPLSKAQTDQVLNKWSAQIRNATIEASTKHRDAISVSDWEAGVIVLKAQLEFARNN